MTTIHLHQNDLEFDIPLNGSVAIDTESMGLNPRKDRLCLIQLSAGDGVCHLVQFGPDSKYHAPRLKKILEDKNILKLFHFARADLAMIRQYLGVTCSPIYCTKVASRLTRTYTDRHSLKELCSVLLKVELGKQESCSDWGAPLLTDSQKMYAASDVLHLHQLKKVLDPMLEREGRQHLAHEIFRFLETCAELDIHDWDPAALLNY